MPDKKNYKGDSYGYQVACARDGQINAYINGPLGAKGCEFSLVAVQPRKL